jgi:Tfp pilus assembly PilM family ATPase
MFSFLNRIIALDLGNYSYKYIEAQLTDKLQILRYGSCSTKQLYNSVEPAKTWKKTGSRIKNAVISFQHKSLITRELELKAYDENHLYSIIQEEFNKYQTDLKEEYDYDFKIQSHIEESGIYLTKAAGISKKANREYIDKVLRLGMRPKAVDIQINAIIRIMRRAFKHSSSPNLKVPCLLIDLGYSNTTAAIVNFNEIIALKSISAGCSMLNESHEVQEKYLRDITLLLNQITDHYIYSYNSEELKQAFLYGGGSLSNAVFDYLSGQIPLPCNRINVLAPFLPDLPSDMDLNLYCNCLGSLYRQEENFTRKEIKND